MCSQQKGFPSTRVHRGVPVTRRRGLTDNNFVYTPHTLGESSPAFTSHRLRSRRFPGKGAGLRGGGAAGPGEAPPTAAPQPRPPRHSPPGPSGRRGGVKPVLGSARPGIRRTRAGRYSILGRACESSRPLPCASAGLRTCALFLHC